MPRFLVAIHRPIGYDAFTSENSAMGHEIDLLNEEMVAAGVRVFVGGLQPPHTARSIRLVEEKAQIDEGLYLQSGEFVGGFWVLDVAGIEAALEWGSKAARACRANVEVRPFH